MADRIRVLGLGNDLLGDDGFGIVAARELERQLPADVEVVCSAAAGLALLDALDGASHLLLLDTWPRGAVPGTIFCEDPVLCASHAGSPHYLGLFDALALGGRLGMAVPSSVACVAVEPGQCEIVGAPLSPAVREAVPKAVRLARGIVEAWRETRRTRD